MPFSAWAGDISGISFTNDPWTVAANEPVKLTINLQFEGDSHPTACMLMFTDSGTGQFSSNSSTWESVTRLTVSTNWANKNFYYKDSTEGNYILTVKVVPVSCSVLNGEEAQWTASQSITIGSGGSLSEPTTDVNSQPSTDSGWPEYVPPEARPKITAYAGKDMAMIVGALGEFRGEGYDFEGNLIENGRYLWSFGDGTLKEGRSVSYFYRYPGEYIVTLDVSSDKNSATDRLLVKVIPNEIIISEIKTGPESFVELYNGSKQEINISGWQIRSSSPLQAGYKTFTLPVNTFIKPLGYSVFPVFLSDMILPQGGGKVELLYQTGLLADSFSYNGFLAEGQSFSCSTLNVEQVRISEETPGRKNTEPEFSSKNSEISNLPNYSNSPKTDNSENYELVITNYEDEGEDATSTEEHNEAALQASVATAFDDGEGTNKRIYFYAALGIILVAGLGVVFVRRNGFL